MNFCLCFLHCLSYLGEIQFKKSANMLLSVCEVLENLYREGHTFCMGIREIMRTYVL